MNLRKFLLKVSQVPYDVMEVVLKYKIEYIDYRLSLISYPNAIMEDKRNFFFVPVYQVTFTVCG